MSKDLVEYMDYDFRSRFGRPSVFFPIRARVCDDLISAWVRRQTQSVPVVISLGEGLDTQFWRLAEGPLRWFSVDLPESIGVRKQWLPDHDWVEYVSCSALDSAWMEAIPANTRPFIVASGLLMYFEPDQVRTLLTQVSERWPGGEVFFDAITPWASRKSLAGWKVTPHYTAPPMPWGITVDELPAFIERIPGLEPVSVRHYGEVFPRRTRLYHWLGKIGPVRRKFAGSLAHARIVD